MHILICEFMDERAVDRLRKVHTVVYEPSPVDDTPGLLSKAAQTDALVVRNRTQVRGPLLEALGRCRVVARLGVGLDNIDVAACEARGLAVIPATGANALSVAEYVIATTMLLLRGAYASTSEVAAGPVPVRPCRRGARWRARHSVWWAAATSGNSPRGWRKRSACTSSPATR